jgi:hypothetical protein
MNGFEDSPLSFLGPEGISKPEKERSLDMEAAFDLFAHKA